MRRHPEKVIKPLDGGFELSCGVPSNAILLPGSNLGVADDIAHDLDSFATFSRSPTSSIIHPILADQGFFARLGQLDRTLAENIAVVRLDNRIIDPSSYASRFAAPISPGC